MKVYVTRDSVAAGDDAFAPHARTFSLPDELTAMQVIARVAKDHLANVSGGKATWSVVSGRPIAVVAQQWSKPRAVEWPDPTLESLESSNGKYRLHFNYHAQHDPELVVSILKELKLHAL